MALMPPTFGPPAFRCTDLLEPVLDLCSFLDWCSDGDARWRWRGGILSCEIQGEYEGCCDLFAWPRNEHPLEDPTFDSRPCSIDQRWRKTIIWTMVTEYDVDTLKPSPQNANFVKVHNSNFAKHNWNLKWVVRKSCAFNHRLPSFQLCMNVKNCMCYRQSRVTFR